MIKLGAAVASGFWIRIMLLANVTIVVQNFLSGIINKYSPKAR